MISVEEVAGGDYTGSTRILSFLAAVLLLSAGASAFLSHIVLDTSFTAEAEKPAVTVNQEGFDLSDVSAGDTTVQTVEIQNNIDKQVSTELKTGSGAELTSLVDYKSPETGSEYSPVCDEVVKIEKLEENLEKDSRYCVTGSHEGKIVVDESNVTLVSEERHGADIQAGKNGIVVNASNVTVRGFNITGGGETVSGITVNTGEEDSPKAYEGVEISDNRITSIEHPGMRIGPVIDAINSTDASKAFSLMEEKLQQRGITDREVDPLYYLGVMEEYVGASYGIKVQGQKSVTDLTVEGNTIRDIGEKKGYENFISQMEIEGIDAEDYISNASLSTGVGIGIQSVNDSSGSTTIKNNELTDIKGGVTPEEDYMYKLREMIIEEAGENGLTEKELRNFTLDEIEDSDWEEVRDRMEVRTGKDLENVTVNEVLVFVEEKLREENIDMREFRIGGGAVVVGAPLEEESITDPQNQGLVVEHNLMRSSDYGVVLANPRGVSISENGFRSTRVDIAEANVLVDESMAANDNWFGTNGANTYGNVQTSWETVEEVELGPGESTTLGVKVDVPITFDGEQDIEIEARHVERGEKVE